MATRINNGLFWPRAKDIGLVGDGIANDTAALQALLNAGPVTLPPGTYRIVPTTHGVGAINWQSNRFIRGIQDPLTGEYPTLVFDPDTSLNASYGMRIQDKSNVKLENLNLKQDVLNTGGTSQSHLLSIWTVDQLKLKNCTFKGPGSTSASNLSGFCPVSINVSTNVDIDECEFADSNRHYACEMLDVENFLVRRSSFHHGAWDGLKCFLKRGQIQYCDFYNNGLGHLLNSGNGNGIDMDGGYSVTFVGLRGWDNYSTCFQLKSTDTGGHFLADVIMRGCEVTSAKVAAYLPGGSAFAIVDASAQSNFPPNTTIPWIERVIFDGCFAGGPGLNNGFQLGVSRNCMIVNSNIVGCDGAGISMQGYRDTNIDDRDCRYWTLENLYIAGNGRRSLYTSGGRNAMEIRGKYHRLRNIMCRGFDPIKDGIYTQVSGNSPTPSPTQSSILFDGQGWTANSNVWQTNQGGYVEGVIAENVTNEDHFGASAFEYTNGVSNGPGTVTFT